MFPYKAGTTVIQRFPRVAPFRTVIFSFVHIAISAQSEHVIRNAINRKRGVTVPPNEIYPCAKATPGFVQNRMFRAHQRCISLLTTIDLHSKRKMSHADRWIFQCTIIGALLFVRRSIPFRTLRVFSEPSCLARTTVKLLSRVIQSARSRDCRQFVILRDLCETPKGFLPNAKRAHNQGTLVVQPQL